MLRIESSIILLGYLLAPRLDDPSSMRYESVALAPCAHQGRRSGKTRNQVLARDEKLDNIVSEPNTHMREGKHAI